jgi:hypothetical protein
MKAALLADIHANADALAAVLDAASRGVLVIGQPEKRNRR